MKTNWYKVSQEFPPERGMYLVFRKRTKVVGIDAFIPDRFGKQDWREWHSHWSFLPEAPKDEG